MSEALNRLVKVLIIAINAQSHSVDTPPPWFGGGDHLCPHGRRLIGSPVHTRSVRSNTYAFLDPSLELVTFLLNCQHQYDVKTGYVLRTLKSAATWDSVHSPGSFFSLATP